MARDPRRRFQVRSDCRRNRFIQRIQRRKSLAILAALVRRDFRSVLARLSQWQLKEAEIGAGLSVRLKPKIIEGSLELAIEPKVVVGIEALVGHGKDSAQAEFAGKDSSREQHQVFGAVPEEKLGEVVNDLRPARHTLKRADVQGEFAIRPLRDPEQRLVDILVPDP